MSTIEPAQPSPGPAPTVSADWIPGPFYRMTVQQYDALAEAEILTKKDKVHLINGYLLKKATYDPLQATADELMVPNSDASYRPDIMSGRENPSDFPPRRASPSPTAPWSGDSLAII
jgi:hypothetical protein